MKKLRFFRDVLAQRWGTALQRIPLDPGFSCPHSGCTFCASNGSRARHLTEGMTIAEQVARGKQYVHDRYGSDGPYIAYFQAFTGTNAPVEQIRTVYEEALQLANFKMVIIGTRPDCLPEECLDYLEELNQRYDLLIELGVQTANDVTLHRINRGHDFACSAEAVRRLHARNIPVAAHLILGLPGESATDWEETARKIAELPFCGVKMHQLMIIKGTRLAAEYAAAPFPVLNEYEYAEGLEKVLRILPDSMTVMRLTAETEEEGLIAPKWWMKKGQFLEMFTQKFNGGSDSRFTPCLTDDGTYTLYHPAYRQHFHSVAGAWEESQKKYIEPSGLREKLLNRSEVTLLDVGFGLGCNASSAIALADELQSGRLAITSLEFDPNVIPAALTLPDPPNRLLLEMIRDHAGCIETGFASLNLIFGDARCSIPAGEMYDVIFLDGFSPDSNPELWTADFVALLAAHLKEDGIITTYSSAYPLFGAMHEAGLNIYRPEPFGRRRPGTAASRLDLSGTLPELSEKDRNITLKSTAGVPYRDPGLASTREQIFDLRKEEVARLRAAGMPKWYKG
ncbi:MAG: TIGR01212 family radical SAM protein [Lentisphaeria bacterium]|nr:TIGR01212 family radical SAM protein [Lentisphaeria bacterium]